MYEQLKAYHAEVCAEHDDQVMADILFIDSIEKTLQAMGFDVEIKRKEGSE